MNMNKPVWYISEVSSLRVYANTGLGVKIHTTAPLLEKNLLGNTAVEQHPKWKTYVTELDTVKWSDKYAAIKQNNNWPKKKQ